MTRIRHGIQNLLMTKMKCMMIIIHFGDDPTVRFKLISLGILPGDPIDVISCAPFGGPQVIGHGEAQSFAIRKEASQFVEVEQWTK